MYKCKYFKIEELVDPIILKNEGEEKCWGMLSDNAKIALDMLREDLGALTINGVFNGQTFTESGLRRKDTSTGASLSQHKEGTAFDVKSKTKTPVEIREHIKKNYIRLGITRIEADTPTWVHFDCKPASLIVVPFK